MNSPKVKKIIIVEEDGTSEEMERGMVVCNLGEESGVRSVFVGLEPDDFVEIVDDIVETAIDLGMGIWVLNILAMGLMEKLLKEDEEDAGLQTDSDSQG